MQKYVKDFFEKHGYTINKYSCNKSYCINIEKECEGYEIEVIYINKNNINIFLWKNDTIVGQIKNAIMKEPFEEYENLLVNECFLEDKEVYIDFKNYICEIQKKGDK